MVGVGMNLVKTSPEPPGESRSHGQERFFVALARAAGGSLFFSIPVLMTMEVWWHGFTMDRLRLAALVLGFVPLLIALDRYSGFESTSTWLHDTVDATVAIAVGFAISAAVLVTMGIVAFGGGQSLDEVLGKIGLQAVPASFGAVLARSQLGDSRRKKDQEVGYAGELLFMVVGAIFLSFNIASTEEVTMIASKMSPWQDLALLAGSLACMHAFVYGVNFRGGATRDQSRSQLSIFVRYTLVGYAISLLASAAMLWIFGNFDGTGVSWIARECVVLAFPASLGAAGARLIL